MLADGGDDFFIGEKIKFFDLFTLYIGAACKTENVDQSCADDLSSYQFCGKGNIVEKVGKFTVCFREIFLLFEDMPFNGDQITHALCS